jgi:spore photoproduct lyase
MMLYHPKLILVHDQSWQDKATHEILERLPGIEVRTIQDKDVSHYGENTLVLMRYPGKFLRSCQGAGAEICCNYFIVSYAWNCHFQCTYCVLQSYLGSEALVVCTNFDDLLREVKETLRQFPDQTFRIGTGELADSLALDSITCYSRQMVPFFATLPNGVLELKTKSDQIANLRDLDHGGRTVISWSMNSKRICRNEELKAATFEERLAAAHQCQKWGYRLGFHFDPIIYYEGWEPEYREAIQEIFSVIDPDSVAWISLGALRFTPHLRDMVRKRFPKSKVPYGEFVPGHHGKLRYFRPIREEMYRKMNSWIHEAAPQVFVYLCMENRLVWERSMGGAPCDAHHLSDQMDRLVGSKSIVDS